MKHKLPKHFSSFLTIDTLVIVLCLLFTLAGALVSLHRFWQYDADYYDFGIFDHALWLAAHFQPPLIDHIQLGRTVIFADHFSPSLFLLAPIFWITDKSEILLIIQAAAVGASGFVLYKIGQKILNNKLLSLSILVCYFLFVGLQNAVITDFHELTVMTLPFMLTFWALTNNRQKLYYLFLLLTLGCKESTFLLGIGLGIAILILWRSRFKTALVTTAISLLWGFVSIKVIIPYFSGGQYIYSPTLPSGVVGKITAFVDDPEKRHTLFYSFFSFGFLPFLSPGFYLMLLQDFATRFLPEMWQTRWGLGLHYNAQTAPILALASLFALRTIQAFAKVRKFLPILAGVLILNALFLYRFVLHGPFALAYNPAFYAHTKDFAFLDSLVKKIPHNASIMTQNNLATRFTHQQLYVLRDNYSIYQPQYIVMDIRPGQNPNDFFPVRYPMQVLATLKRDSAYRIIYHTADQYIFQRK